MAYSVTNLKGELAGILHGTTLNQVQSLDELIYRAVRQLLLDIDPHETKRIVQFTNPIYNSVYDYFLPTDVKGNRIIDIRPQVNRTNQDFYPQSYNRDFDLFKSAKNTPGFTIQYNSGVKTIRISNPNLEIGTTINECDSITGNGTFAVGGDASTLVVDDVNFVSGSSSLSCTLINAGTTGYIENSTMQTVDLTSDFNQGKIFLWVYLPTAANFTSVAFRWGSSSSAYYTQTKTSDFNGNTFVNGWNLLAFDWLSATQVGVVDITKINYLRTTFNYNGTLMTGVKIDNAISRLGTILECEYYSKYLFKDAITSAWQETITDDSNIINLDQEGINPLLSLVSVYAAQQVQGYSATQFDYAFWQKKYEDEIRRYAGLYKSEVQKPQSTYYKKSKSSYMNWANIRFQR
jgi:hypothetical protein